MNAKMIVMIALSAAQTASVILKSLDRNATGSDDEAARAIDIAIMAMQKYLTS